jgi:hypothetical protein
MLSTRSRIRMVPVAIAVAAIGATAGLASPASDSQPIAGVTVDQSAVARHRALGRLGTEPHVLSDAAAIARHRALGQLPLESANVMTRSEPGSSSWVSWASLLGFAALAAGLIAVVLTRFTRVRRHGTV